jgi:hypothetical protein
MANLTPSQIQILRDLDRHGGAMTLPVAAAQGYCIHLWNAGLIASEAVDMAHVRHKITETGRAALNAMKQ